MFRQLIPALAAPLLLASACAKEASIDSIRVEAASPIEALRAAPDRAHDASTARVEMTFTIGDAEREVSFGGEGSYDAAAGRMSLTFDLGGMSDALAQTGEVLPSGFDEPLEIVVDGDATYLRVPMLEGLTGATGWLSLSVDDLSQAGGTLGLPGGSTDPLQILEALRGVGNVEEVGSEDVRGVPTTRYEATIDLATALAQAPAEQRDHLEAQLGELDATLDELPVSTWIDADGLVRRLQIALGAGTIGAAGPVTMVVELFDYGEPVDIVVPAPEDVTPFGDVLGSFSGALTDEPA